MFYLFQAKNQNDLYNIKPKTETKTKQKKNANKEYEK